MDDFDLIVIGGGNAGLCAAMSAVERRRKILLIERAPEELRGGNSKYTRDIRCCQSPDEFASGYYGEEEFLDDLLNVTGGRTNLELARQVIRESFDIPKWMERHGVKWQKALKGTLHLSRTNRFFIGGGKAMINSYYEYARKAGVKVIYDSKVEDIRIEDGEFKQAIVTSEGRKSEINGSAVVVSAGGFEANIQWLKEYWGSDADNFIIRGTKFNDGSMLRVLMSKGAMVTGDSKQFHAVAVDARSPKFDGGVITRIDSVPFSIVVNKFGRRFYDEGEDLWPKRYAIWGKLIAEQPDQIAYSIFDSKVITTFLPTLYKPYESNSLSDLARLAGLDPGSLTETVAEYNAHVQASAFDPTALDGCRTSGLDPPKSHWALRIDTPPFFAYPLRPGITFTYMGVTVDKSARVMRSNGKLFQNVYAAGEIMSGNILTKGYLAGFGLTIGTTFGRRAGGSVIENT